MVWWRVDGAVNTMGDLGRYDTYNEESISYIRFSPEHTIAYFRTKATLSVSSLSSMFYIPKLWSASNATISHQICQVSPIVKASP